MDAATRYNLLQALLLQVGSDGRAEALFGESYGRVQNVANTFMIGDSFPDIYLEFPLIGEPFLDMTYLYHDVKAGARVEHEAAAGTEAIIDWFASVSDTHKGICFGYELDTKEPVLPAAGVHFQPREHTELVQPFCDAAGEPKRAQLYLEVNDRLPDDWKLSFFGMFRGRPDSPLRVCGYLDTQVRNQCAEDAHYLASVFEQVGFKAYDQVLLDQAQKFFEAAPGTVDFQFDVYPDGHLGNIFALDIQFEIEQPEQVKESFTTGAASRVMDLLKSTGVADDRVDHCSELSFARGISLPSEDGAFEPIALILMPVWVKARWKDGVIQPSKLYIRTYATELDSATNSHRK